MKTFTAATRGNDILPLAAAHPDILNFPFAEILTVIHDDAADDFPPPLAPEAVIPALHAQGFRNGPPRGLSAWAQQCDRQAARESTCPCCGRAELAYLALHRGRDYRAVARCERCGNEMEF